jgi:RNA polymerase sigma factor (sigma-70 family)
MPSPIDDDPELDAREQELGAVLAEIIERHRSGESVFLDEYIARFPHLAEDLRGHLEMLAILETLPARADAPESLGDVIAALPEEMQQILFLRHFRPATWHEIASQLGQSEESVRRQYADALGQILKRCGSERA